MRAKSVAREERERIVGMIRTWADMIEDGWARTQPTKQDPIVVDTLHKTAVALELNQAAPAWAR